MIEPILGKSRNKSAWVVPGIGLNHNINHLASALALVDPTVVLLYWFGPNIPRTGCNHCSQLIKHVEQFLAHITTDQGEG